LIQNDLTDLIGNTPLIKLNRIVKDLPGKYFAKCEFFNPGHSNKDRIALHIIKDAEKRGLLKPGSTIIETTSGNTGFSIAMVSLIRGYKCILAVSSKSSSDKINMLKSMGAKVYVCPANVSSTDSRSYYQVAKRINKEIKNSFYVNQYFNDLNTKSHYLSTGPEIWDQTNEKITHLIGCSGTGGTLSGSGQFLKEKNASIKVIGVDAYGSALKKYHDTGEFDKNEIYPNRIEGLGKNLIPSATNFTVIDFFIKVSDEDSAYMAKNICKNEGMFVGYTSGAAMQALAQLSNQAFFDKNSNVVVIFPDHGSRYMSKIYNNKWMTDQGFNNYQEGDVHEIEYI